MKKFITITLLLFINFSFSQDYFTHDYRYIPADKLEHHIKIEKHYWSKVAQLLVKEGKLMGWAMLQKEGGSSNEPNIYFYIGIGDKNNLDNLYDNYAKASKTVLNSMGEDAAELVQIALIVEPTGVFNTINSIQILTQIFDNNNKLDYLENFISKNGPLHYELSPNIQKIMLKKQNQPIIFPNTFLKGPSIILIF